MLQSYPMYAYIPAKDVARARRFHEGKAAWFKDSEGNIMALIEDGGPKPNG